MAEVIVEVRWLAHALGQAFDAGRESVKLAEADDIACKTSQRSTLGGRSARPGARLIGGTPVSPEPRPEGSMRRF
jgi:hypothetical protein